MPRIVASSARTSTLTAAALALVAVALPAARALAGATFAGAVPTGGYTMGNVFTASGVLFDNPATALGAPNPIVGTGTGAGVLSPFNGAFENTQLVAVGRGGSLTLQYQSAVPVGVGPEIGIFTAVSWLDEAYPSGVASSPPNNFAHLEYGAERTAVVEVAQTAGNFVSLGRVKFDKPTNYFNNATGPFQFPAPASPDVADFGKPFTTDLTTLAGASWPQILAALNGSAGGTWIDVPTNLGLSHINYLRISDPMWQLDNGTLVDTRTSIFNNTYVKPADLFIDAVSGVPEPSSLALLAIATFGVTARRSRCRRP
jgi:hypothetical protein